MDSQLTFENDDNFDIILIKPKPIDHLDWFDKDYTFKLIELNCYETINVNKNNFLEIISEKLNLEKFKLTNDLFAYNQQYDKYRKNKLNATFLVKRLLHIKYGNSTRSKLYEFINFGLELANTLKLDLDYFNYIIGFIVFVIQIKPCNRERFL
jgi:hypothetical protein